MASTSDAAAEIEAIIQSIEDLSRNKSSLADAYAGQAITTSDALLVVEGAGDFTFNTTATLNQINPSDLPPANVSFDNFDALAAGYTATIQNAFYSIINQYFPDDATAHQGAVNNLTKLAAQSSPAIDAALARLGGDTAARGYLNDRFSKVAQADSRLATSIAAGADATAYLQSRLTNGSQAAAFMLAKFMSGNTAVSKLLEYVAGTTTAIPTFVEDQTWQRDRNRILLDAARQKAVSIDQWAARGWPLPPGPAIAMSVDIDNDATDKISAASRDRVIKNYDVILENMRLGVQRLLDDAGTAGTALMSDATNSGGQLLDDARAATTLTIQDANEAARVLIEDARATMQLLITNAQEASEKLLNLRIQGIDAALQYMKAIALGPQLGLDAAKTQIEAKTRVAETTAQYFTARVNAASSYNQAAVSLDSLRLNAVTAMARNRTELHLGYNQAQISKANIKAGAATASMQSAGSQAAAALSGLTAIVTKAESS